MLRIKRWNLGHRTIKLTWGVRWRCTVGFMIRSRYSGTFANERCQYKGLCGGFAYIPSIGSENPWYTVLWQITIFNDFVLYSTYEIKAYGKLTKSGIPGWFLNKIGYRFFCDGARSRTSAKRLQNAFWRLNSLRLVCAQHPKPFFRCSTPQNSANHGAQKVLSTNNPILFRNTPGITQHNPRFRYVLQLRCHPWKSRTLSLIIVPEVFTQVP